jgi:arginase
MADSSPAALRPPSADRPTLVGLPYDAGSSYQRGAAEAPRLIRKALFSGSMNLWSESGVDLGAEGALGDFGDVALGDVDLSAAGEGEVRARIEAVVAGLLDRGERPLALGGDHSVSYPVLRAFRGRRPGLTILHLDAHPDLYDAFEGDPYSHASPFARIMEEGLADRLVQVGIRTLNAHQRAQAARFGVEVVEMRHWSDARRLDLAGPVYVSLDVDVLDPAFAPGVSHHEAGGLSARQVITILQEIKVEVAGADLVEFNPRNDPTGVTAALCAKLVKELAAAMTGAD